ncbi:MAG: glycosyltransferase family 39 protein [Patescibacteria group bacterium]
MKQKIYSAIILIVAVFFRIYTLGYSDFQGDEVSAQNFLFGELTFPQFLASRTIGPAQYILNYLTNLLFFNSQNVEFFIRLPYALAGILTVMLAYKVVNRSKSKRNAALTTFVLGSSGLLIAFSRIVQYQSFVILLGIINLMLIQTYNKNQNLNTALKLSFVGILGGAFHYDFAVILISTATYLALEHKIKHLLVYSSLVISSLGIIYLPILFMPISLNTVQYVFGNRVTSNVTWDALNYSLKLLQIYHSKEFLLFIAALLIIWVLQISKKSWLILLTSVPAFAAIIYRILNNQQNTELTLVSAAFFLIFMLVQVGKTHKTLRYLTLWFGVSFLTYGLLFQKPLTHIYTFLVPLLIMITATFPKIKSNALKVVQNGIFAVVLVVSLSFNYQAFIETNTEYPWQKENYIFGNMPSEIAEGANIDGIFGFPYYRNWKEVGEIAKRIAKENGVKYYDSNEKGSITKYHMQGFSYDQIKSQLHIRIERPQSMWTPNRPNKNPIYTFGATEIFLVSLGDR